MDNEQFIQTLFMTDTTMNNLNKRGINILKQCPNLDTAFHDIAKFYPFLSSLEISRLFIIKNTRNANILKDLSLLRYIGRQLGILDRYNAKIKKKLSINEFEMNVAGSGADNGYFKYRAASGIKSIQLGNMNIRLEVGAVARVFYNEQYIGNLVTEGFLDISRGEVILRVMPDIGIGNYGKQEIYAVKMEDSGSLTAYRKYSGSNVELRVNDIKYTGVLELYINFWGF